MALDTKLDAALVAEGLARELVSRIQAMRKEADLAVTDRIAVDVHADADVVAAARLHAAYIHDETLVALDASRWAESSLHVAAVADEDAEGINGHPVRIALSASPA